MYLKRTNYPAYHHTLSAAALLCFSQAIMALPEDSKAILLVHAGSADLNQSTHLGTYGGGVALDQGTTHIRAARALTQGNAQNQLIKAVIEGEGKTQAHYWTLMSQDKPMMHAYADKIIYYPLQERIELIGHALVKQGQHQVIAPVLHYHIKTQHVVSLPQTDQQTVITIHPEQKTS
ncbi:MAG: lipopolysaccharide transport periplasmic protein LptA [Legionella sp.]|nr:MAG: lipopolysaccharide transport periplasmic protein LptA [Legionella sp.]